MSGQPRWKPKDWLRLISLVGAFGLFGVGTWMLFQGISAEGVVDLRSTVFPGTLKASSAGLYLCFFALFIITFVLVTLVTPVRESAAKGRGRARRLSWLFWALLSAIAACGLGLVFLPEGFRGLVFFPIGFLAVNLGFVVDALIRLAHEDKT